MTKLKATLYLGRNKPDGFITQRAFDQFITDHVAQAFQGFTILDGIGYWQSTQEQTKLLTVIQTEGLSINDFQKLVAVISERYCMEFHQGCVLVEWSQIQTAFYFGSSEFVQNLDKKNNF